MQLQQNQGYCRVGLIHNKHNQRKGKESKEHKEIYKKSEIILHLIKKAAQCLNRPLKVCISEVTQEKAEALVSTVFPVRPLPMQFSDRAGTAAGERGLGQDGLKPERTVGACC